ncbi:nuclease-related domain-containing protein [Janibacter sp. G1551]|uniref:nuclease-related domain-containing protein n=1 Tax=Janibacter sp. G1551 TaxID=3420440 RepID=UPI003CFE7051
MAVGGGSADRRAEALAAAGDETAGAWAAGAEGERRVAAALATLPEAWTVLHDRLLAPGRSPVNLDHVVVGPGGVFLIDAKNWKGSITAWEGNLYQHTGNQAARRTESKHAEVAKVHGMARYLAAEAGLAVTPVICLAGPHEADFGQPQDIRGVVVIGASRVSAWLRSLPVCLDRAGVERAVLTLMTSFPSTTTEPHLLAAMASAAPPALVARRRGCPRRAAARTRSVRTNRPGARRKAPRRALGRVAQIVLALALMAAAPSIARAVSDVLVGIAGGERTRQVPSAATPGARAAATSTTGGATSGWSAGGECAGLSARQVGDIVGRAVHPVASGSECSWGTRLGDPTSIVLALRTQAGHRASDVHFERSVRERSVVYGEARDNDRDAATALWVAAGQPIVGKRTTVTARVDTQVVVSTADLEIAEEESRWMARAIAMGVNAAS